MRVESKLQVLQSFHMMARSLTIYNSDNFVGKQNARIIGRNLFRALLISTFFISLIVVVLMCGWMLFTLEQNKSDRVYFLGFCLIHVQQLNNCTIMTKENRKIVNVLEQLQLIVDKRE